LPLPSLPYFRHQIEIRSFEEDAHAEADGVAARDHDRGGGHRVRARRGVGESVAQDNMKKNDTMKMDDTMKTGDKTKSSDTMKTDGMKDDMKSDDMKKDGKAMMKDDKMMQGDKTMEKKQ
jgi:hypothetical protein